MIGYMLRIKANSDDLNIYDRFIASLESDDSENVSIKRTPFTKNALIVDSVLEAKEFAKILKKLDSKHHDYEVLAVNHTQLWYDYERDISKKGFWHKFFEFFGWPNEKLVIHYPKVKILGPIWSTDE